MPNRQDGVVLIVVLLMLLLTSIVVFSSMQTSDLEAKMAAARLGQEVSFQAAESAIDEAKNDGAALVRAYQAGFTGVQPTLQGVDLDGYPANELSGQAVTRYAGEGIALGNDISLGGAGLRSLHFEVRSEINRVGDNTDRFDSIHRQGIRRYAPKIL